ncbi:MAG: hypothetical protein IPO68_16460 [Chitinophagaceae bacterium]|nr:hypothetical protein [Chitinophagaceae bacterium]
MEVHAHTHTPRKKWTHYFWEFIMLFLAVFCGFLAENQREHMIEHQREKKFIRSLISDLSADTTRLGTIIHLRNERLVLLDSFMILLNKPNAEAYGRLFIILIRMLPVVWLFVLPRLMALCNN